MSQITFIEDKKSTLVEKIKNYFENELSQDVFNERVESITDAIYELEVPTEFSGR